MSDPSNLSFHVNLEFLRKEAKSLLKLCRSRDAGALSRIRAGLPRIAGLDDERAAVEIKLADVQCALAREQGYPSWAVLKQRGNQEAMPDFSQPGADGTLPEGLNPWCWYLGYTVRPEMLSTLVRGQEYRIAVSVLRKVQNIDTFTGYAELYARATGIANARATQLKMPEKLAVLHTRILTHGWFRHGNTDLVRAFVTIGASCLSPDDLRPQGERIPTPEELTAPGQMPPDSILNTVHKNIHEIYGDIVRDPSDSAGILLVSYGEYSETCSGIDYEPFLKRAERLAKFHRPYLRENGAFRIVRREWFCATNPDIAVVHLYLRCSSGL